MSGCWGRLGWVEVALGRGVGQPIMRGGHCRILRCLRRRGRIRPHVREVERGVGQGCRRVCGRWRDRGESARYRIDEVGAGQMDIAEAGLQAVKLDRGQDGDGLVENIGLVVAGSNRSRLAQPGLDARDILRLGGGKAALDVVDRVARELEGILFAQEFGMIVDHGELLQGEQDSEPAV